MIGNRRTGFEPVAFGSGGRCGSVFEPRNNATVQRRERLGGLLNFYHREAA